MDTVKDQYFNWLCRTCMQEVVHTTFSNEELQQRQWQSIFDIAECDGTLSIAELLSNTIPQIEVSPGDNLSKKICITCLQQLSSMHRFQRMCIQSDREMREKIAAKYENLNQPPAEEQTLHLPKGQQSISDPLENVGEAMETCRDSQVDYNLVRNEPSADNDEYIASDNHRKGLFSTINIKEEVVTISTIESSIHGCAICKKKFKESRYLKRHLNRHDRPKEEGKREIPPTKLKVNFPIYRFQCNTCNEYFHEPESLHEHRLTHEGKTEQNLRACNVCEKTFSSRYTLRAHKKKEHSTENIKKRKLKEYSCEICNKNYKSIGALNNHISKHTDSRPFLCPECGKTFTTPSALDLHRLRHSDVRPFECPICPARFHCSGNLIRHKITHEAIKQHICDICGKGFGQNYELKAHKKYHSGEKPFKCNYCEMRFVRRANQRRHMLTHTGEKPYKCKYCEHAFAQVNDHAKHLRTHLGENIYWCTLCPSTFRLASERRVHFVTHKNDDEETRERNMKALKDKEAKLQLKLFKNEVQQPF